MAVHLKDTICGKTDDALYGMVESGWNSSLAALELKRRGRPAKRPKVKSVKVTGRPRFRAKRHCGVTGGHVNLVGYAKLPREVLPGTPVEPWNR
jgi:hypothetical protein